jgi:hypothetical protein
MERSPRRIQRNDYPNSTRTFPLSGWSLPAAAGNPAFNFRDHFAFAEKGAEVYEGVDIVAVILVST